MKTNDEIRNLSVEEIKAELTETQHELFQTRIKIEAGQEKDTSKSSKYKNYLARLKTILREKQSENQEIANAA